MLFIFIVELEPRFSVIPQTSPRTRKKGGFRRILFPAESPIKIPRRIIPFISQRDPLIVNREETPHRGSKAAGAANFSHRGNCGKNICFLSAPLRATRCSVRGCLGRTCRANFGNPAIVPERNRRVTFIPRRIRSSSEKPRDSPPIRSIKPRQTSAGRERKSLEVSRRAEPTGSPPDTKYVSRSIALGGERLKRKRYAMKWIVVGWMHYSAGGIYYFLYGSSIGRPRTSRDSQLYPSFNFSLDALVPRAGILA